MKNILKTLDKYKNVVYNKLVKIKSIHRQQVAIHKHKCVLAEERSIYEFSLYAFFLGVEIYF